LTNVDINKELSQNFIDFSYEANCQRAFADARDGLKPGQRACLWEMFTKGYTSNRPHVKSAKISGGVIASWWPHGDTAIYDTFARMSQSWINNMPEVDWHGANGSIQISGEPAASRYTEARLAKVTEEGMLGGIKKHNVPMIKNFSEDEEWPQVFPALMPRLMINGCQGIGSTIANVWLTHNLKDIARIINNYLLTGEIDYADIAPDFPSGGIIINKNDLPIIYKTGKGKVILRGRTEIKDKKILITEIPYQVYVEPFITQIKELMQKDELTGISNILNKSDKKKLLIEIECDESPASVLNQLYRKTNLQKSYSANQFALVGKTPELLNLKQYLNIYLQHNYDCIKREYEFDFKKAKDRLEIVIGLIKALEDIDNIIVLIKASDSSSAAIQNLIKKYDFTERQAKAIVDMKLGRLARLEKVELNNEKEELTSTTAKCEEIINNVDKRKEIYLNRFNAFVKKYGKQDRRTELTHIEVSKEEKEIAEVTPVDVVVVTTKSGLIKKVPVSNFRVQRKGGKGVKSADDAIMSTIKTNTVDYMMFFSDTGKMYRTVVDNIPDGTNTTKGVPINSLIQLENNEKIIAVTSLHRKSIPQFAVFVTKQGMFKKTFLNEYLGAKKNAGIAAIKLREGDSVASVIFQDAEDMVIITKGGMSIRFETKSIGAVGRVTMGVKGIKLAEDDEVIAALPIHKETDMIGIFTSGGMGKKVELKDFPLQGRGGKGTYVYKPTAETGEVVGAAMLDDNDNVLLVGNYSSICISATEIPVVSKLATGNILIKNNRVLSIAKL
jgi:DNA gyrase subunit A